MIAVAALTSVHFRGRLHIACKTRHHISILSAILAEICVQIFQELCTKTICDVFVNTLGPYV